MTEARDEVILYHGHNGQGEFWESEPRSIPGLLLSNHGTHWQAEVRYGSGDREWYYQGTLEALVRMVAYENNTGWRIILSDSCEWREPYSYGPDGVERMQLVALEPGSARAYGWDIEEVGDARGEPAPALEG